MKTNRPEFDQRLANVVEPYIRRRETHRVIDPSDIADMVMGDLDKEGIVKNQYPLIFFAAHSAYKQTARAILRRRYPRGGGVTGSQDEKPNRERPIPGLEIDKLQRRYPQAHAKIDDTDEEETEGRGYVLREAMTEEDWLWNIGQFDKDIAGRQRHREQFKQWGIKVKGWADPDDDIGFGERERC